MTPHVIPVFGPSCARHTGGRFDPEPIAWATTRSVAGHVPEIAKEASQWS